MCVSVCLCLVTCTSDSEILNEVCVNSSMLLVVLILTEYTGMQLKERVCLAVKSWLSCGMYVCIISGCILCTYMHCLYKCDWDFATHGLPDFVLVPIASK